MDFRGRRSVAILVFMIKEGGPLTSLLVVPLLAFIVGLIFPIVRLIYW